MAVELFIEDKPVDLTGDENIALDYAIAKIGEIQTRTGARSVQFNLLKTTRNRAIFENPDDVNNLSTIPYRKLKARLYADGIDQQIAFCTLEESAEAYNCRLYGVEVGFFDKLKDASLQQIDLSEFDYYHTLNEVVNLRSRIDVCHPVLHNRMPNLSTTVEDIRYHPPGLGVEYLLERICAEKGYTLHNFVKQKYDYPNRILFIPFTGSEWKRDGVAERYNSSWVANTVTTVTSSPVTRRAVFTLASNPNKYLNPAVLAGWNGYVALQDKIKVDYHVTIKLDVQSEFFAKPYVLKIRVKNGDSLVQEYYPTPPTVEGEYIYTMSGSATLTPETAYGDCNAVSVEFNPGWNNLDMVTVIDLVEASIVISNATMEEPTEVGTTPSGITSRQFCTINSIIPDIKQTDLLKAYCQMFCALIKVNEKEATVSIVPFNDIAANLSNSVDWSDKLDFAQQQTIKYSFDNYGKQNIFDWSYEGDDNTSGVKSGQGVLSIADENLPDLVKVVELPFSLTPAVYVDSLGAAMAMLPVFDADYNLLGTAGNRLLFMKFVNGPTFNWYNGTTNNPQSTNTPVGYFHRNYPDNQDNLDFGGNLLSKYYNQFAAVLDNYRQVTCQLRLNAADINQLDFTRPVYIKHFNAYFYINTIKGYSPMQPGSTTVELIKLF